MTKYLLNLILAILIIYSLVLIYIYIFQRNLLYHPKENNYLDNQIDFEYKEIFIPVNENIKLKSWIIEKDFKKNKTLIFFRPPIKIIFTGQPITPPKKILVRIICMDAP